MESAEYASAVKAMSEVMAKAEEEARDFVVEKAEELGEDGALEAALMEAFVAFDSDNDGKLIGQELAVLLEVSGRTVPPELLQERPRAGAAVERCPRTRSSNLRTSSVTTTNSPGFMRERGATSTWRMTRSSKARMKFEVKLKSRRFRSVTVVEPVVDTSTLASEASFRQVDAAKVAAPQTCWKLELDALGELQLRLAGGVLAPSRWVALRISDFHVRGPLSPAEMDPLCFLLTCDVVCHDAAAAQLLPLVEQFEVTVDLERRRNEICCNASTARVNVNIDRVLVDFFRTVRQGLKQVQDAPMQPVRSFNFHNGTGVQITVRWRQGRQSTSVELLPGMCSNVHHLSQNRTHRFAEVRLWLEEFQLEEVVTIDLDHTFGRAYQVREGCPIFVEPEHDLKDGKCTLHIKSALTIHNDTALPLRLTLATAMFQKLSSQVSDLLRSGTRIVSFTQSLEDRGVMVRMAETEDWDDEAADGRARFKEFQGHLDVPAQSSVEVPVSWFVFSQMHRPSVRLQALGPGFGGVSRHFPQLAALLEDVSIAEDEDFDDEDVLRWAPRPLATGARLRPREAEAERRGDRTKFSLFLRTYMKLSGYIDAQESSDLRVRGHEVRHEVRHPEKDLPLALDEEDVQQVQRFQMHLGNLLAIRNMLPFPVVFQMVTPDNSFKDLPLPDLRSVHEVLDKTRTNGQRENSRINLPDLLDYPARCYAQVEPYENLVEHTQLDGIAELAMTAADRAKHETRGLVTYAACSDGSRPV
eukprot:g18800.t1